MSQSHSKITAQGQVTVPADIRRALGVGPGSVLEWNAEDGAVVVRRSGRFSLRDIHAVLFATGLPEKLAPIDVKAAIGAYMKRRHARD